jgi:RNA-directed DNA polymerase
MKSNIKLSQRSDDRNVPEVSRQLKFDFVFDELFVGGGSTSHNVVITIHDIASKVALHNSWLKFSRGKKKRSDVVDFAKSLKFNLESLSRELTTGVYRHESYSSFMVQDPKTRIIHKASVRDRIVHQSLVTCLERVFDKLFIYDSYSCRPAKGTHAGHKRLVQFLRQVSKNNTKSAYVLKCDIKKYFASVDHDLLLEFIKRRVMEEDVLRLIEEVISSHCRGEAVGLPLGNVTSQLFANIYLNEFDRYIKHTLREQFYVRYCDDFLIVSSSRLHLESLIEPIREFLKGKLKLTLHPEKVELRSWAQGVDFLGYITKPGVTLVRTKTKKRALRHASAMNAPAYLGVLSHADTYEVQQVLNSKVWLKED